MQNRRVKKLWTLTIYTCKLLCKIIKVIFERKRKQHKKIVKNTITKNRKYVLTLKSAEKTKEKERLRDRMKESK